MRRSNCSAPIPPGAARDQRKNVCDKKGRGTGKKSDWSVYIGWGKVKKVIRRPGQPPKKVISKGLPARGNGG